MVLVCEKFFSKKRTNGKISKPCLTPQKALKLRKYQDVAKRYFGPETQNKVMLSDLSDWEVKRSTPTRKRN
jgi:hypothetical protein